jgi:hypothetical protein
MNTVHPWIHTQLLFFTTARIRQAIRIELRPGMCILLEVIFWVKTMEFKAWMETDLVPVFLHKSLIICTECPWQGSNVL